MLDKTYVWAYAGRRSHFDQRENGEIMGILPAGTRQIASASFLDAGGLRSSFKVYAAHLTAVNEALRTAAWADVLTAAQALVLGNLVRQSYNGETTFAVTRPTNGAARELALKIIFRDGATGQTWESLLPTLNPALISYDPNYGAKDVVLMTTTEVAALVAALEALPVYNPYDYNNTGDVVGMQVVRGFK